MKPALKSPYPYFGGKSRVCDIVWQRFGDVRNYVEPFFGSGAMLLGRPHWPFESTRIETVNDLDDANEYLAACTESIVYTFQEIKNVRKEYKPPLAPVDSRLAGAGSVDGDAEPGSCGDGELPQVCS